MDSFTLHNLKFRIRLVVEDKIFGTCCKSATALHQLFVSCLNRFAVKKEFIAPLQYELEHTYMDLNWEKEEREVLLKRTLQEVEQKLNNIEEKYYALNEMGKETFQKFYHQYIAEKQIIEQELTACQGGISNYQKAIEKALSICENISKM